MQGEERGSVIEQSFQAEFLHAGDDEDDHQHAKRHQCFQHLAGGERGAFAAVCHFGEADALVGENDGEQQADTAADQRREFVVHLREQGIRHGAGEDAEVDVAEVFADFRPAGDEAQGDDRDNEAGDEVDDAGLFADLQDVGVAQYPRVFQFAEAKPGRRADCAEGYGHGVHDEGEDGNLHRFEAEADEDGRGDGSGCAEAACAFDHEGEGPADNHQLRDGVGVDVAQPLADDGKAAGRFHHAVEEDCAEDDGNGGEGGDDARCRVGVEQHEVVFEVEELQEVDDERCAGQGDIRRHGIFFHHQPDEQDDGRDAEDERQVAGGGSCGFHRLFQWIG